MCSSNWEADLSLPANHTILKDLLDFSIEVSNISGHLYYDITLLSISLRPSKYLVTQPNQSYELECFSSTF